MSVQTPPEQDERIPFWRDERNLQWLAQIGVLIGVVLLLAVLIGNMQNQLRQLGLPISFKFLKINASFDIGESLIPYSRADTYWRAYLVGVLNTIQVAVLGIIFTTILGVIVGVARLSTNWLVNKLAAVYIEILRNIPLLVLLIFWYTGFFLQLPDVRGALNVGGAYFSQRGIAFPWPLPTETTGSYHVVLLIGLLLSVIVGYLLYRQGKKTGRMPLYGLWALLVFLVVAALGIWALHPYTIDWPHLPEKGFNFLGGKTFSPEFMALLSGLVIYTSAFVAEVVRAGIQSVSKGQVEAARALGLNSFETLRFVVFPQALRVIVPPMTSQYLNLTKNSSLAVAIGYPDIVHVYGTIINQSGRAVEMTMIMMATYLTFSLSTSAFMNWYNQKIKLVER